MKAASGQAEDDGRGVSGDNIERMLDALR
jgi:hypothetical protein